MMTSGPLREREQQPAAFAAGMAPVPAPAATSTPRASRWFWFFGVMLVVVLVGFQLFVDFRGLSDAGGMGQATVARELARGHGFQTQVIDPLTVLRAGEDAAPEKISLAAMPAMVGGPLQPLLVAGLLKVAASDHAVTAKNRVYMPDRLIAALATLCFLLAVWVSFALVRQLFDSTLATATTLVLLLSDLLWSYSASGLPHMLAMLLTMLALRSLVGALEAGVSGRSPLPALLLSGLFCGLLMLALPLAGCLVVGLTAYVAVVFRRNWKWTLGFALIAVLVVAPWWWRNASLPGSTVFGAIEAQVRSEPGTVSEERLRSSYDSSDRSLMRVDPAKKLIGQLGVQFNGWWVFTGGSLAAVLFFPSLLHPFRSPVVASLRWALLASWLAACLGMAVAGLDTQQPVDAAALHVLFLPLFSAYGMALLSVLWGRTALAQNRFSLWRNGHLTAVILLTALPMLAGLPGRLLLADRLDGRLVHWPPFDAFTISKLGEWTDDNALVVSDLPEAVAWYADRSVLRLPTDVEACGQLMEQAKTEGLHPIGFYLSARIVDGRWMSDISQGDFRQWAALVVGAEPKDALADLLRSHQLRHRLNLSPSQNQRAWLVSDEKYWEREHKENASAASN